MAGNKVGHLYPNQMYLSMKGYDIKILFLHGLDSSKESTKFHTIASKNKFCINVDYRNLNFETVQYFYQDTIQKIKPDLLIGHGIGGYWALKMSYLFQLPTIVANPSLTPTFRADYPKLEEVDLNHDIPQVAYLELGDELVDMHKTQRFLEHFMFIETYMGGYHRLEHPENINKLIAFLQNNYNL